MIVTTINNSMSENPRRRAESAGASFHRHDARGAENAQANKLRSLTVAAPFEAHSTKQMHSTTNTPETEPRPLGSGA
jgi:hypothetical protein